MISYKRGFKSACALYIQDEVIYTTHKWGEMRLPSIDNDLLYRGAVYGRVDSICCKTSS